MNWSALGAAGVPLAPSNLWSAWSFEPSVLITIAVFSLLYIQGMLNAHRRAEAGRSIPLRRWVGFLGALLSMMVALMSPLDALSHSLFSAHNTQHVILMMITAPLLVLSDLPIVVLWALPRRWAQALGHSLNRSRVVSRLWKRVVSPVGAWLLFAIPMWVWHTRTFYQAALQNETLHALEHLVFVVTAMLFWWILFKHSAANHLHYGMAVAYLFTTAMQSSILGALMTFTTWPWYPYYAARVAAWGMTPLQDQQLGGLIMWMPGGLVFALLTIGYFAAWLHVLEQRSARLDRRQALRADEETE